MMCPLLFVDIIFTSVGIAINNGGTIIGPFLTIPIREDTLGISERLQGQNQGNRDWFLSTG